MNDMKKRIFTFIMTSAIGLLVCAGQMPDEKCTILYDGIQ